MLRRSVRDETSWRRLRRMFRPVAIRTVVARSNRLGRERTPVEEGSRLQTASRRRNHLTKRNHTHTVRKPSHH